MKNLNRTYLEVSKYIVVSLCIVALFVSFLFNFDAFATTFKNFISIISPIIYGLGIAYVIIPLINFIETKGVDKILPKKKSTMINRAISMLLGYGVLLVFFISFFAIVLPQIGNSLMSIAEQSQEYTEIINIWIVNIYEELRYFGIDGIVEERITEFFEDIVVQFTTWISGIAPHILNYTFSAASSIINSLVALVVSIYVIAGKERFAGQSKKTLYALFPAKKVNSFMQVLADSDRIFGGFIVGKIIDSIIIGILCYISMEILNIPESILISVIVGITNIIPYFGPFIGAIPSIFLLLLIDPSKALLFAIFIIVLQQFDGNYLGPKILGDSMGISAIWVIFSVTLFGGLYGVIGMILGVPLFAVVYKLSTDYINSKIKSKSYPKDTASYSEKGFKIED